MVVLAVAVLPFVVGLVLIAVLARFAPNVPRTAPGEATGPDGRPELDVRDFGRTVTDLVAALGLETGFASVGTGGVVEMTLRDPRPLVGGRIHLHATPVLDGALEAADVLGFAEAVRADTGAHKGILIALAGFTDEARSSAQASPAPVDLVDGAELAELVASHLDPERAAALSAFRGFGRGCRGSASDVRPEA
ncbi:MAG: restriction endonuclease [Polyangiaceae bacterium]|nr:restriction endonuclease [Polyangiaceae bacterium]